MNRAILSRSLSNRLFFSTTGLVQRLSGFRETLERESDVPLEALTVSAILLLSDLCAHLGLTPSGTPQGIGRYRYGRR